MLTKIAGITLLVTTNLLRADDGLVTEAKEAIGQATRYYHQEVARHGGYVYHHSLDLKTRWGEGLATEDQIWVQPPGTPTVGLAFLKAYEATGNEQCLRAAVDAAHALTYGQLKSGGWQNCVDFDPRGQRVSQYRNGQGGGKNNSSFDDGQSQSALLFLIRADAATGQQDRQIHNAVEIGLQAVLNAQFPCGGFPQVWTGPVGDQPVMKASYPSYNWRTEGRIKEYWNLYTLNDNVPGYLTTTLLAAYDVYQDERYLQAVKRLGDFLLLAQMPQPQPGWAQQYSYDMKPVWARKFEPPAVAGDETQEAIETLLRIHQATGDEKYLEPIPRALEWLQKSVLPDGRLARYYELKTNRPLYMERQGDVYSLTYDDGNLPSHYGWKITARISQLRDMLTRAQNGKELTPEIPLNELAETAKTAVQELDNTGRWITVADERPLVGQPKIRAGERYISSETFSERLTALASYIQRVQGH